MYCCFAPCKDGIMERMTPTELLRLLEEESSTLGLLQSKVSDQLRWLKVEEDLLIRKLLNPEHGTAPPSESDELDDDELDDDGRELIKAIEAGSENDEQELQTSTLVEENTTTALGDKEDVMCALQTNQTECEEELEAELLNELLKEDMNSLQEPSPPKKMASRRGKQKSREEGPNGDDLEMEFLTQEKDDIAAPLAPVLESSLPLESVPLGKRKARRPSRFDE